MILSHLARSITESPTFALNEEARILREKGEPVINLGIGEPKNKAPINAILSSVAKVTSGEVKYSPPDGLPSLKKAIIRYTEENYDRLPAPENVIVSAGAKQSLFNVLYSIMNPQDEVIILAPYWVSYPEMVKMVYGVPVIVTPEDGTFHPRMEDIERKVTQYTRAVILNSPNNPSGAVFRPEFIAQIVEFCERKKIYLILDDIYHKLVFDGKKAVPGYRYTNKDIEFVDVDSGEWCFEALRHDRFPYRVGNCAAPPGAGDDQRSSANYFLHLCCFAIGSRRSINGYAERGGKSTPDI